MIQTQREFGQRKPCSRLRLWPQLSQESWIHTIKLKLWAIEIFDPNLSVNKNLACSYCHDPAAGYANGASIFSVFTGGSNPGSVPITVHGAYPNNRIAKRNPQSYAYASYFPPLHFNQSQADFYGGNFWGRPGNRIQAAEFRG
jgi:cytochrome c peroxidase